VEFGAQLRQKRGNQRAAHLHLESRTAVSRAEKAATLVVSFAPMVASTV